MTDPVAPLPQRLWEIDHPYYGAEAGGAYAQHFDTFAELKASVDGCDEDMNFVYRWDWFDPKAAHNDDLFCEGESRDGKQKLTVFLILQRKSGFLNWSCDVTHEDEPAVLQWLHSDRIAGALRRTWEPILDSTPPNMDLAHLRADIDYWRGRAQAAEAMVERLETRVIPPATTGPGRRCICPAVPAEPGIHFGGIDPDPSCGVHGYLSGSGDTEGAP